MASPVKKDSKKPPSVVMVGTTGDGKSTFGNFILSKSNKTIEESFSVGHGMDSNTENVIIQHGFVRGDESRPITLIDTPGLDDSEKRDDEHLKKIVEALHQQGQVNAFVLVRNGYEKRFTASVAEMLQTFEHCFGSRFWRHLLFKVKSKENIRNWNNQLIKKFPNSESAQNAPTIQIDCKFDTENPVEMVKVNAELDEFYNFISSSEEFDCSTIDQVKSERDKLKEENDHLKEQLKSIQESLQNNYSQNKTGETLNKSQNDGAILENEERKDSEDKSETMIQEKRKTDEFIAESENPVKDKEPEEQNEEKMKLDPELK